MDDAMMQGVDVCHDVYGLKAPDTQSLKAAQKLVITLHCRLG